VHSIAIRIFSATVILVTEPFRDIFTVAPFEVRILMRSFVGSVARQRPISNNGVVFSLGSVLRSVAARTSFY
jgi:hypothetical protein